MKIKGWELEYFQTGEWQYVDEKLKDLEKVHRPYEDGYSPSRKLLFEALRRTPMGDIQVCIVGQDPYPTRGHATGIAFSIPDDIPESRYPPTLRTFLGKYSSDLRVPVPSKGSLDRWTERGVLLWNAIPSCAFGKPLSHDWPEWEYLTKEIIQRLSERGIVFALLGGVARRFERDINTNNNHVIVTSHPSPRGSLNAKVPFVGSRLFSTINDRLNDHGLRAIDWKLE